MRQPSIVKDCINSFDTAILPFRCEYAPSDEAVIAMLLDIVDLARINPAAEARATRLINSVRSKRGIGTIENMLNEFSLSTKEGLALMVLAESLLRVPDTATADHLLEDKLSSAQWSKPQSGSVLATALVWTLGLGARLVQHNETPEGILGSLLKRLGRPAVRAAARQAMRIMGNHFVLGETIEAALNAANNGDAKRYRYSYDMLGEGARTAADAQRHFESYSAAIDAIGGYMETGVLPARPGISVKLSALHPRFEAVSRQRVLDQMVPLLLELARKAKAYDLNLTVDAEEADRLELSLDIFAAVLRDDSLRGWDGFGLAIQAYQKRALHVIEWVLGIAQALNRRLMVRLVKGAYWDTEVKRAQERGLDDYPVFTHKAATDLNYLACAKRLLEVREFLYPQFATHNALTIATIVEMAGGIEGFEFQRLHGMGETIYATLLDELPTLACRVYAPVGQHKDLLAYLVRRLLENSANSSFVSSVGNAAVSVATLLQQPPTLLASARSLRHPRAPIPALLFGDQRCNSAGIEFGHEASFTTLIEAIETYRKDEYRVYPANCADRESAATRAVISPIDGKYLVGRVCDTVPEQIDAVLDRATASFQRWERMPVEQRVSMLEGAAELFEQHLPQLLHLLQMEAGKTLEDGLAEVREAVDFCRYYAAQARKLFNNAEILPGPTGEDNRLGYRGRGVFVCISPWNFPLAIFIGQIAAALAAGNAVIAKPAEQTPLIAAYATDLLHAAGVPANVLQCILGDGAIGAGLVRHPQIAGVVFTGSTETAWTIQQILAEKRGAIVPLIAETGGINAMIVDATALPEQVADDVIASAFRSAGQRCSALRLLCIQDDIAEDVIKMITGAAAELRLGDPRDPATHIGPVIDATAYAQLNAYIAATKKRARLLFDGAENNPIPQQGYFVPPCIFELESAADLSAEVFGPVLHIVRWRPKQLPQLLAEIASTGYGLTLGIHTRIDTVIKEVVDRLPVGNIYVNRNMVGAVVGSQPFGGVGLSGTGPKAGGPHYLLRFSSEQVVSTNTSASGGNASLLAE